MCTGADFKSPFDALPQGFMPSEGYGGTLPGVMPSDPFPTTISPTSFGPTMQDYISGTQIPSVTPPVSSPLGGTPTAPVSAPPPASFTGQEMRGVDYNVVPVAPGATAPALAASGYGSEEERARAIAMLTGAQTTGQGGGDMPPTTPAAAAPRTLEQDIAEWSQMGQDPTSQAALAKVLANQPGWAARNIFDPVKGFTKDYGPLLGMGATGAGVLKQLLQPGGVEALSPLQQEQLNLMRQQQQTAQQYMTGQVTPEMQQNLMNQTKARITAIKDKYAKLGMSGSTAENQDLAAAQAQATQQLGQMQAQMIQTGAQMMGLPAVAISRLTAQQDAQSAAFNQALARFVASMAGRPQDRPTP